ncbi:MAG: ATP-binding protein [Candidatus Methanomethylophilaceae archaeon]|nr:ATP-binding protein [Candidatus Methanomethylophilaceae archaeon]
MRFYGRESELAELRRIRDISLKESRFTVITGRRRIGKTSLMLRSVEGTDFIYIFISRKSEVLLCEEIQRTMEDSGIRIVGRVTRFRDLFRELMLYSVEHPITVIMDEFQDIRYVNEVIFSEMQEVWDLNTDKAHINLIVSGSVHSMMVRIFEDSKEPLFGRPTGKIMLNPLPISKMKEILNDHNPDYTKEDLLILFMLTGGVPYYMQLLMDNSATDKDSMLNHAFRNGSTFLTEGKDLLVSEFGNDYRIFFSILQLISSGKESRSEMEDILGIELGAYLKRLESEYGFIRQIRPAFSEKGSRNNHWIISDMYLRFYFRFINPRFGLIESGRSDLLIRQVMSELNDYEGKVLEEYFRRKIAEGDIYTQLCSYWSRKGDVEIDIIVLDDVLKTARVIEVKRNREKIDIGVLMSKAERISQPLKGYAVTFEGLSLEDM